MNGGHYSTAVLCDEVPTTRHMRIESRSAVGALQYNYYSELTGKSL